MKHRSLVLILLFLFPVACSSSSTNSWEWLKTRQLREEPVTQLQIESTRNSLIAGEKSNLNAYGMVGSSVRSMNPYVTYHVDGTGWIEREGHRVFYATSEPSGPEGVRIYATLDSSQFGREGPVQKSNIIEIDVYPRGEQIELPEADTIRVRSAPTHHE